MEESAVDDASVSLERLVTVDIVRVDAGAGETDVDVNAELEGDWVSGVPSRLLLKMLSSDIFPLTRWPTQGSASEPADLGR